MVSFSPFFFIPSHSTSVLINWSSFPIILFLFHPFVLHFHPSQHSLPLSLSSLSHFLSIGCESSKKWENLKENRIRENGMDGGEMNCSNSYVVRCSSDNCCCNQERDPGDTITKTWKKERMKYSSFLTTSLFFFPSYSSRWWGQENQKVECWWRCKRDGRKLREESNETENGNYSMFPPSICLFYSLRLNKIESQWE